MKDAMMKTPKFICPACKKPFSMAHFKKFVAGRRVYLINKKYRNKEKCKGLSSQEATELDALQSISAYWLNEVAPLPKFKKDHVNLNAIERLQKARRFLMKGRNPASYM